MNDIIVKEDVGFIQILFNNCSLKFYKCSDLEDINIEKKDVKIEWERFDE